jgi:hypothetical protein
MVRKNLGKKLRNAALYRVTSEDMQKYISEYNDYDIHKNPGVSYFGGRKVRIVPNFFDIQAGKS